MNGVVVAGSGRSGRVSTLGRVAGATVAGAVVPWVVVLFAIGSGMLVVAVLGLGEYWGVAVYLALLGVASLVYAGVIYAAIRMIGARTKVPWPIWPALLVAPVISLVLAAPFADPRGVLEAPTAVPALLGVAVAFVALGKRRWTEVA